MFPEIAPYASGWKVGIFWQCHIVIQILHILLFFLLLFGCQGIGCFVYYHKCMDFWSFQGTILYSNKMALWTKVQCEVNDYKGRRSPWCDLHRILFWRSCQSGWWGGSISRPQARTLLRQMEESTYLNDDSDEENSQVDNPSSEQKKKKYCCWEFKGHRPFPVYEAI